MDCLLPPPQIDFVVFLMPMPLTYTTICGVLSLAWGLIALAIRETLEWKGLGDFLVPSRYLSTDLM
jgi:hypothetical protein